MQVKNLRVEIDGVGIAEYRNNDGLLEYRTLDAKGRPCPDQRSAWKRLTPNDVVLHMRFKPIVGKWIEERVAQWEESA